MEKVEIPTDGFEVAQKIAEAAAFMAWLAPQFGLPEEASLNRHASMLHGISQSIACKRVNEVFAPPGRRVCRAKEKTWTFPAEPHT